MKLMDITHDKFLELQKAHKKAVRLKKPTFVFYGVELDINYVKYLLEYLEQRFKNFK